MKTKIIKINPFDIDQDLIKKAASLIDDGKLIAFPAETVYGIACRIRADSIEKLNKIKSRTAEKHYSLHISHPFKIASYVPTITIKAQKIIKKAWPGPLTIVFALNQQDLTKQKNRLEHEIFNNLYKNSSIGIRCPNNPVATMLLENTVNPVFAPSANVTGRNPATDAQDVIDNLSGKVDMVIDAGECKYKKSSTVIKIDASGIKVLREGVFSKSEIEDMSKINFLFVCTGNSCRSPMAEGLFRKYLAEKLQCNIDQLEKMGYKTSSAGTMGLSGMPASREAVIACAAKDVEILNHRSTALSEKIINESDIIYVMEKSHLKQILDIAPQASEKCFLLADRDIPDPIGKEQYVYDDCAQRIEKGVKERVRELKL